MVVVPAGRLFRNISSFYPNISGIAIRSNAFEQVRNYAARRGTREKADRKKAALKRKLASQPSPKKKEVSKKVQFNLVDDSHKGSPVDNVYFKAFYKWSLSSVEEAVGYHREMFHPTMFNQPDAFLETTIEMDMQTKKKTKFLGEFTELVVLPHRHSLEHPLTPRSILAFCKNSEEAKKALAAGATTVGGIDLIKSFQMGKLNIKDYEYCVAHVDILADLLLLRGVMKKKFPNVSAGSLGNNMTTLVEKFSKSIPCNVKPHPDVPVIGTVNITFAKLDMDVKEIEENLSAIVNVLHARGPNYPNPFIKKVILKCPPSSEIFRIDFQRYLPVKEEPKKTAKKAKEEDEEDDDEEDASSAVIGAV